MKTTPTDLHQTIAYQIHNQKPAHLVPGQHIGMEVIDAKTVGVIVIPTGVTAAVRYDEGPDTYTVSVRKHDGETTEYGDVYCDQLGDLIFGVNAEPATFPMGGIQILDPVTGEVIEEMEF